MKKIITLILGVFLCFTLVSTAGTTFADDPTGKFIHDQVGLLKVEEKAKLEKEAQDIYNKYKIQAQLLIVDVGKEQLENRVKEYYKKNQEKFKDIEIFFLKKMRKIFKN